MAKLGDRATFAGLAWIREEDYATLLTIFEDGDQFAGGWKGMGAEGPESSKRT